MKQKPMFKRQWFKIVDAVPANCECVWLSIQARDGCTTVELKNATGLSAKKVYNAIKVLTRKRLVRSTYWEGSLRR